MAERTKRHPGLPGVRGHAPDYRRGDLIKAGLASRWQIIARRALRGPGPSLRHHQILCPGHPEERGAVRSAGTQKDPVTATVTAAETLSQVQRYKTP